MAERKAAGGTSTHTITHEDGSAVTPQEMYDAFMSGLVILETIRDGGGFVGTALDIEYIGTPDNITGCIVYTRNGNLTLGVM